VQGIIFRGKEKQRSLEKKVDKTTNTELWEKSKLTQKGESEDIELTKGLQIGPRNPGAIGIIQVFAKICNCKGSIIERGK